MEPRHNQRPAARWEHFPHDADIGLRGFGATAEEAFEQAARALTAAVTSADVARNVAVEVCCEAPDLELLFVEWLNAIIYEMAVRGLLFGGFAVRIDGGRLEGTLWGEPVDVARHAPANEPKGATYEALKVSADVQAVAEILDRAAAEAFGLRKDEVVVTIHCDSRGLGHQIAAEFSKDMVVATETSSVKLPDRELACAPIDSDVARRYLGAMRGSELRVRQPRDPHAPHATGFPAFLSGREIAAAL